MEILFTFWVPKTAPLLFTFAAPYLAYPSPIRFWLETEGSVVTETVGAVLPANRSNTVIAGIAFWVA